MSVHCKGHGVCTRARRPGSLLLLCEQRFWRFARAQRIGESRCAKRGAGDGLGRPAASFLRGICSAGRGCAQAGRWGGMVVRGECRACIVERGWEDGPFLCRPSVTQLSNADGRTRVTKGARQEPWRLPCVRASALSYPSSSRGSSMGVVAQSWLPSAIDEPSSLCANARRSKLSELANSSMLT